MADCLIVGFNDGDFPHTVGRVRKMGENSGAWRDLRLSFIEVDGRPQRALELLSQYHHDGRAAPRRPFNNAAFLWPVILVLGTALERRGHSFDFVNLFHFEREELAAKLQASDLKVVAITTTLYVEPHPVIEVVAFIRRLNPTVKIVIGGPYIAGQAKTLEPGDLDDQLRYLGGDIYIVSSEGETALANLVGALKQGAPLGEVPNLIIRSGDGLVRTTSETEANALEENMVRYGRFDPAHFGEFVTLRTAKSCPFACSFCGFPERAGAYKYMGVEDVERELDQIAEIGGVTTLTFIDDTFNVPKKRFKDLLRLMIRKQYGFRWNSFYRCDHGDEETIDLMGQSGCEGVVLGVESGSDKMLKLMNKTVRREHYVKAIPRLHAAGIETYASLIIGFPGETRDTVRETTELLELVRPSWFRAQLWYCDPITPIYRQRLLHGIRGTGFVWRHNTMDCDTACDYIDRLYLSVDGATWLPQAGFELWSTFFLQRKGMRRDQVHAYARGFNRAIRERLVHPSRSDLPPARAQELRRLARFDVPGEWRAGPEPADPMTGPRYRAAEAFWIAEFPAPIATLAPVHAGEPAAWTTAPCATAGGEEPAVATTLLTAALARLTGMRDVTVVVGRREAEGWSLYPLRVALEPAAAFAEVLAQVRAGAARCEPHRPFALHVVHNKIRMGYLGAASPALQALVIVGDGADAPLEQVLADHPTLAPQLQFVLRAGATLEVGTRLGDELTRELAGQIEAIAARASDGSPVIEATPAVTADDAEEAFQFGSL